MPTGVPVYAVCNPLMHHTGEVFGLNAKGGIGLGFSAPPSNPVSVNFLKVIGNVCGALDAAKVRYALIGGFAMALRGVQRSTIDLDFILMLQDLDHADAVFHKTGYERAFRNENEDLVWLD